MSGMRVAALSISRVCSSDVAAASIALDGDDTGIDDNDDVNRRRALIVQQYARLVAQLTRQPNAAHALAAVDDWRATAKVCQAHRMNLCDSI